MTKTSSKPALLHVAMQDLYAGKMLLVKRVPVLADQVRDEALGALLCDEVDRAREQGERLQALGDMANGPANLWMAGIMDDADGDARSHLPGVIIDIALLGAIRKAKAAEIVSLETAIALADDAILQALQASRKEEIAADTALRARLVALTGA